MYFWAVPIESSQLFLIPPLHSPLLYTPSFKRSSRIMHALFKGIVNMFVAQVSGLDEKFSLLEIQRE